MKNYKVLIAILLAAIVVIVFQNCARSHFNDPDPVYSALVRRQCQVCEDGTGSGLKCADTNGACVYESCVSGFQLESKACVPVVCEAGTIASCALSHGEGRMTCQPRGDGYATCVAISCDVGFQIQNEACVAVATAVCVPDSHRDCSSASTYGTETCNAQGSGYDSCVLGACKPGYNLDATDICVANVCDSNTVTPCTAGAGVGFQTCNSQGSAWGACSLNGCQPGYNLIQGVCVTRVCAPNEESVCLFDHGTGTKTCNADGTNYGPCSLVSCETGFSVIDGQCIQQKCVPETTTSCQSEGGSGLKYCYQNGQGYGPCEVTTCDPGFKLKNNQCVSENSCETGETFACTGQNGSGFRSCQNNHSIGPCMMTRCNANFELVNQGGSPACKATSNGKNE